VCAPYLNMAHWNISISSSVFAGLKLRGRDQRTDTDYAILPVAVDRIQLVQQIIMKHAGSFLLFCFVVNVFILGECSPCY